MPLTPEQLLKVESATSELERAVAGAQRWLKESTGGVTGELLLNEAERAAVKATRLELVTCRTWQTVWRGWAEKGWHPDGYEYKLSHYLQVGNDLAKALSFYSKQAYNARAFNLAADAAEKKVQALGKAAEEALAAAEDAAKKLAGPWSTTTKVLLSAGGVTLAAILIRQVVR